MTQKRSPGQLVIDLFGGGRPLARKLNAEGVKVHHSSVTRWAQSKENAGTGGLVPNKYHRKLIEMARKEGFELTPEQLVYGDR